VIAAALVVLYLSGPRVVLDTTVHPQTTDLPDDLDQHLRAAESRYSDITPGAEKTVVWADPQRRQRTPVAFVYLHGFSATRQESVPVPGDIAAHFNSNIYYARLAGNGRSDDALAQGSVNKWVNDVAEALAVAERLGEKTVIIGCSTGASLAWWAAHQPLLSERVSAMVFLSPNFGVADPRASVLLMPWGAWLARLVVGQYRESEPISEAHAAYWTNRYPISALLPMMGMVKLAMRYPAQHCKVPVHVTYSTNDDTVSVEKIKEFCALLPANCETLEITQPAGASQHVIVGDILAPENNRTVTAAVISFLTTALTEHS
jgi:alpha-beta hydrolase superfamily lysophospholipase